MTVVAWGLPCESSHSDLAWVVVGEEILHPRAPLSHAVPPNTYGFKWRRYTSSIRLDEGRRIRHPRSIESRRSLDRKQNT